MPIFETLLSDARLNQNCTVESHLKKLDKCWVPIFENLRFQPYKTRAYDATKILLQRWGMWGEEHFLKKWADFRADRNADIPAGGAKRDLFIEAVEVELVSALQALYPPPPAAVAPNFDRLMQGGLVAFPDERLLGKATADDKTKICAIYDRGAGYRGHGPTVQPFDRLLIRNILHAHVGQGTGLAFKWTGQRLEIHGLGKKSDAAGAGTSGYNWTTS